MGYGRQKWHSFFSTIGRHLECAIQTELVVELELLNLSPHRKEAISLISAQFYHMPGRYERMCVGWHCAKVKGHAELKIEKSRVKTFICDFPKLHHSSPNSFGADVHLRQISLKTVKVIERSRDITPRSKVENSKGRPRSPCAPNMVQFRPLFPELRHLRRFRVFFFSYRGHSTSCTFVPGKRSKVKWSYK